jgi:hypothetical protein
MRWTSVSVAYFLLQGFDMSQDAYAARHELCPLLVHGAR